VTAALAVIGWLAAFALLLAVVTAVVAWSDRRWLAAGGECVTCRDSGMPGPLEVRCRACRRWAAGYEP
jgi:hypothetical protein